MKKTFLSATALSLLIPMTASALGLQVIINGKAVVLADVPQSAWYTGYVRTAVEAGIVTGYQDERGEPTGLYGPANRITIAEALKIAVEGAGYDAELYGRAYNSGTTHWSSPYVSVAKLENFVLFENDVRLDSPATRAEVASIFYDAFRAQVVGTYSDSRYNDVDTSTPYAEPIEALSRDEVVSGDTDASGEATGTFRPYDAINRAEVTKMVIEARAQYGMPGEDEVPEGELLNSEADHTVSYTADGFSPAVITIKQGESVMFKNDTTFDLLVATDDHPSHTKLPSFESDSITVQGGTYIYTFNQLGTWGYHNHLRAQHTGTVIVE